MRTKIIKFLKKYFVNVPQEFKKNHITFNKEQTNKLRLSIEKNYLDRGVTKQSLSKTEYEAALNGQLTERLAYNRNRIVPWLNKIKPLSECTILEVGCGTGVSSLVLTEQGAKVSGIDIDKGALMVAEDRLRIANLKADFYHLNANSIQENFKDQKFDFIIFYAALEHMTVDERIDSLNQAWNMLSSESYLVVIETPNRLWHYDSHTSALPFYDWLPDDLAFYYSKFSSRNNFKDLFRELNSDQLNKFLRWGRGMSYHEFEIAIKPIKHLNVVSSLPEFEKSHFIKYGFKGLRYLNFIKSCHKDIQKGFCYPYLDIIIKKD